MTISVRCQPAPHACSSRAETTTGAAFLLHVPTVPLVPELGHDTFQEVDTLVHLNLRCPLLLQLLCQKHEVVTQLPDIIRDVRGQIARVQGGTSQHEAAGATEPELPRLVASEQNQCVAVGALSHGFPRVPPNDSRLRGAADK